MRTVGHFDTDEGADEYIRMAEGYDGRELIEVLQRYVPSGSSVLEIGMGPGKLGAKRSLEAQNRVLNRSGIALHSLWLGDECEECGGLLFQQYTPESFAELTGERFGVLESKIYAEMASGDSLCVVPRRLD